MIATMEDHRTAGRVRVKGVHARHVTSTGIVVDLSKTGARVAMSSMPAAKAGDQIAITLQFGEAGVTVRAQVVWVRKVSRKEYLLGIKFGEMNESEAAALAHLARAGRQAFSSDRARERF